MHTYVRRALQTALVTGGLVAAGASMAHAEEPAHDALVVDLRIGDLGGILDPAHHPVVHAPGAPRPGADPAGGETSAVTDAAVGSAGGTPRGPGRR